MAPVTAAFVVVACRTRAILVNNPSNPCGSVYSKEHLTAIIAIAEKVSAPSAAASGSGLAHVVPCQLHFAAGSPDRPIHPPMAAAAAAPCPLPPSALQHRLPIIADEIYGNLVFPRLSPAPFIPMASLSANVPIIAAGGIAKEFLVPGWRVGWVALHDRHGIFGDLRKGLFALTQLILGASSLIVAALPSILAPAAGSADEAALAKFHADVVAQLEDHAVFTFERIAKIPGVKVVVPQGAM